MNEKAKKYIINLIDKQAASHPCLTFKYGYDSSTSTHIVDVEGKDDNCLTSDSWQEFVFNSICQFEDKFENDLLLFVSSDSLVRVGDTELLYQVIAKTQSSSTHANSSWLTKEGGYTYNPHADTPKRKTRKPTGSSLNFSPHKESALTNVRVDFFFKVS